MLDAKVELNRLKDLCFKQSYDKAPGPDGFNARVFFHKYWNIVEPDVAAAVQSFITTSFLL